VGDRAARTCTRHLVGFANSVVVDLQGNRPGA
jgi:hypothetical protein